MLGCERAGPYAAPNLRKRERLDRETEAGMAQVFTALATNQLHRFSLKPKGELRNGICYARSLQVWIVTQVRTVTDVDRR